MSGMPPLFSLNGCGVGVYGKRDFDVETSTYVKTYCLCFLFIPVLPICAYRVADAENGGWYFLGREPLSGFAKYYNYGLVVLALYGFLASMWKAHTNSPDYRAGIEMQKAGQLEAGGDFMKAAAAYIPIIQKQSKHQREATEKLSRILTDNIPKAPADKVVVLVNIADNADFDKAKADTVRELANKRLEEFKTSSPPDALKLFDALAKFTPAKDKEAQQNARLALLEGILAKDPQDAQIASEVALAYEAKKDFARCEAILAPAAKSLKDTEGARILGQIYQQQGKNDESFALLSAYADAKLPKFQSREKEYTAAMKRCYDAADTALRAGRANPGFYTKYNKSSKEEQQAQVEQFVSERVRTDPGIKAALAALEKESGVVPVALDLGILRLQRAQDISDPQARRKELEAAEKMFLAIHGVAGETDEYKLFYGQVCYWLGKHDEGKKLFDDLLASKKRSVDILVQVAMATRSIGAVDQARKLLEEAYDAETDAEKKQRIAASRGATHTDLDDRIKWAKLTNTALPPNAAELNAVMGEKAVLEGKYDEARALFQKAMKIYSELPKAPSTLNNGALIGSSLFDLTRDPADFRKAMDMLLQASALQPTDTTLMANAAATLLQDACLSVLGEKLDIKAGHFGYNLRVLRILYSDEASRTECINKLVAHPSYKKAMEMASRLEVLAPRSISAHSLAFGCFAFTDNTAALRELNERMKGIELDYGDNRAILRAYSDEKLADHIKQTAVVLKQAEGDAAVKAGGKELAIANATISQCEIAAHSLSTEPRPAKAVAAGERAYSLDVSQYTRYALTEALFFDAAEAVAARQPAFKEIYHRTRRSLEPQYVIAFALIRMPELRSAFLEQPSFKRGVELIIQKGRAFKSWTEEDWPLAGAIDAAVGAEAKAYLKVENRALQHNLAMILSPLNAENIMNEYFARAAEGDEAGGLKKLEAAAKLGVPLPVTAK